MEHPSELSHKRRPSGREAVRHRGLRKKTVSMPELSIKAVDEPRDGPEGQCQ